MVENILAHELGAFLKRSLSGVVSQTPGKTWKAPEIINGFLPPKRDAKDDFPFVVIIPVKGSTDGDKTETDVRMEVGAWSEEYSGYEYAMNIMSRIRNALMDLPDGTLAGKFRITLPITWEMDDEQPYPGWLITMTTTWWSWSSEVGISNERGVYGYLK